MNQLQNLYKRTFFYENPEVETYSKLDGWLKKKKEFSYRAQIGFNGSSKATYFCFFDRGQILAYFKGEPKDISHIINIVYMSQIESVLEDKDKKDHFKIILKEGKIKSQENNLIHIKCENNHNRTQWIKAIQFFKDYH